MPIVDNEIKLDFKDVLIRPKRSTIKSRADVSCCFPLIFFVGMCLWQFDTLLLPVPVWNWKLVNTADFHELFKFYGNIFYALSVCRHNFVNFIEVRRRTISSGFLYTTWLNPPRFQTVIVIS